jgi:hypothetical protein
MTVALAGKLSTGQSKTIRFPKVRSIGELGVGTVMQFTLDLIKKSAPKMPMAQEKNTVLYRLHDYCSHFSNNGDFIMGVRL